MENDKYEQMMNQMNMSEEMKEDVRLHLVGRSSIDFAFEAERMVYFLEKNINVSAIRRKVRIKELKQKIEDSLITKNQKDFLAYTNELKKIAIE